MPWPPTIGSQALPSQLHRVGLQLRQDVRRHSLELTTGQVADPGRQLRGDLGALSRIESRLQAIGARDAALKNAALMTEAARLALDRVAESGDNLRDRLVVVTGGQPTADQLALAGQTGLQTLETMLSALSTQVAGRSLFSGIATDRGPLPDAATLMAAVTAHLAGAETAAEVAAGVDDFFHSAGGPFETAIYAGGAPAARAATDPEAQVAPLPTAADPALRGMLRQAVLGALLAEPAVLASPDQRRQLAGLIVADHPVAQGALVGRAAGLGEGEAVLDSAGLRLSAERDALVRARDGLIGTDAFAAASRLEETRSRLEVLYAVTARAARLSLTEFLR